MTHNDYSQFMVALCTWREARGEMPAGHLAVARTIYNRSNDEKRRWPPEPARVVLQTFQFSAVNVGDPNSVKYPDFGELAYYLAVAQTAATMAASVDPTGGANHYFTTALLDTPREPGWYDASKVTATIGNHVFLKL